jgi:hypothetical protein
MEIFKMIIVAIIITIFIRLLKVVFLPANNL